MASIAPILRLRGKVRQVNDRNVPPVAARDEQRDPENGSLLVAAREGRAGYDVLDVVLDTDPGGLVEFVITPGAMEATGGWTPAVGDVLDVPVRGYTSWKGRPGNRYATNGYSLAGDVLKSEGVPSTDAGRRVAAVG